MPIGLPSSPTTGQQYPVVSPIWEYDGAKWVAIAGTTGTATPVTDRLTSITGTDDFIGLRGGVPNLVAASVIAAYTGGAPAATEPAALTAGQWTAEPTVTAGEIGINISTLPADGGSAITALEYRVGAGAAIALTGTATGLRVVTAGFTAGVAADVQVRAVNAVGAGAWSDTKNRTPLAGGGGGAAAYGATGAYVSGTDSVTINRPAGATASDQITVLIWSTTTNGPATMATPTGWTAGATQTNPAEGRACRLFTAPGNVAELTFTATGALGAIAFSTNAPLRAGSALEAVDYSSAVNSANRPSPAVTATLNDLVVSLYVQYDDGTGGQMPTPGTVTPYTRRYHLNDLTAPFISIVSRAGVAAGTTGTIAHDSLGGFSGRFQFTGAYGS